ncbi:kinesin heavy chain [Megalops cyprinoides]|uniref:kinesin heavy chain n=1 Tax=Megalops cyprinoides TaxID=118141 RepID=UPI00186560CB|nr:kinesin heavy chain [Megalops cyprinoides]
MEAEDARSSIQVKEPNRITVDTGRGHPPQSLDFDAVWDESATQKDVYESTAKLLVESLLKGYNGCVITYGSPGSGKSYTLLGGSLTGRQRGILSRAAEDIFSSPEALTCKIRVSFIHVSNEKIYDLLESQPAEVCRIHEGEEVAFVEGLKEVEVSSSQALLQLYRRGAANRHTGVSKGEFASRSHAIFTITAISMSPQEHSAQGGLATISKLTLVDLASSGKALPRSGALMDGRRSFQIVQENAQEAKMLKRSLTIFGNVVFALSTAGCQHVPYRESKLTRVLRECLGGNCRTSLVVTVSSSPSSITETLSSLQFACRAMSVPARAVHRVQMQSVNLAEKPRSSPSRRPSHQPGTSGTRVPPLQTQTCLPPIVSSPPHRSGCGLRRVEEGEQKAFLPQLGLAEGGPQANRSARGVRPVEERGPGARSLSSSLVGFQPHERNPRPEVHPSPRASVDKLPPSLPLPAPAAVAGGAVECPNCKRERKIREEYDKFIVQARRERDVLTQRVEELEAQLLKRGSEEREGNADPVPNTPRTRGAERSAASMGEGTDDVTGTRQGEEKPKRALSGMLPRADIIPQADIITRADHTPRADVITRVDIIPRDDIITRADHTPRVDIFLQADVIPVENDSNQNRQQTDSLRRETAELRAQLEECRSTHTARRDRGRTALHQEELERRGEAFQQQIQSLQSQKESLVLELQRTKAEHSRLTESFALTLNDLQKQKDKLLSQVEETKMLYEKVRSENGGLREQVEALLRECSSRPCPDLRGNPGPPHVHTVTTNTEMLVVSHQVSQQCASGRDTSVANTALLLTAEYITLISFLMFLEGQCCFNSCNGFQSSAFPGKPTEPSTMNDYDDNLLKTKDTFKQLRREHSLLLDVMLVLYKRGWFADDAVPYVQRTLRKCGLRLNDVD